MNPKRKQRINAVSKAAQNHGALVQSAVLNGVLTVRDTAVNSAKFVAPRVQYGVVAATTYVGAFCRTLFSR